jgi:PhnB protein
MVRAVRYSRDVSDPPPATTIAPWLTVPDGAAALVFYRDALGAVEAYRLDGAPGQVVVAQLRLDGAPFWLQEDPGSAPDPAGQRAVRMIVTVADPDALFARALRAGATAVAPVHEEHGWRTGRIADPFGHDWELSRPVA